MDGNEDGNEDGNFLTLCIKRIEKISRAKKSLNERQCANLLSHLQKCLYVLQDVLGPCMDGCGPLWKDLLCIVSKASLLLENCQRDDWYQVAFIQNGNKEAFRELLLELEAWFHTICDKMQDSNFIGVEEMAKLKLCTTLHPPQGDEIEKDEVLLQERLANAIKMLPCNSDNYKLSKYLLDMMGCLSKVEEDDLSTSQFPTEFHCPQSRYPPETLGDTGQSFVQVHATTWLGLSTATKIIKVENMEMKKHFEKEALILGGLRHPNIAKFFYCGYVEDTKDLLFGMEKGERNLSNALFRGKEHITYVAKLDIMLQVASGMYYLHDMKVAHRDLKPANVIITSLHVPQLDSDGYVVAKLVDFGTSKIEVRDNPEVPTKNSCFGTIGYVAPEAMKVKGVEMAKVDALKVDVFSFGVLCYEIFTQSKSPFVNLKRDALLKRLKEGKEQIMPNNVPLNLRAVIEECWSSNPYERPTFSNIHERLTNIKRAYFVATSTKYEVSHPPILIMDVEGRFEQLLKKFLKWLKWLAHICCALFSVFFHGWWLGYERIVFDDPTMTSVQANDTSRSLKHVVGLERKLTEFEERLGRTDMLGIVGMGGVGKTTFVKALGERLHKGFKGNISLHKVNANISQHNLSSAKVESLNGGQFAHFHKIVYLPNIKDDVSDNDDHLKVMGRILKSLNCQENIKDLKQGREILMKILRKINVLLILDDVGGIFELDLLLTSEMFNVGGSKLIATSRDWDKLQCVIKNTSSKVVLHTLDEDQSMRLFSKHAFIPSQCACPPYLQQLSKKIVNACGGLPLSLEVMGSHLCGKARIRTWERALQRLLNANLEDGDNNMKLWNTLRISFDDLIEEEKKMFLDISCYFCKDVAPEGVHQHIALHFWDESLGNAQVVLSSLVNKSLVRVEDDGALNMHDQLRDVGRMLSKRKFEDSRKWNWSIKSINEYTFKGFQNVEGLCCVGNNEDFQQSSKLKIQLTSLRLLSYKSCSAMDMLCSLVKESKELRWLSIKFSEDNNKYINGIDSIHMISKLVEHNKMKNLLVLIIMDSPNMKSFPNNTNFTSLRSLTIQRCEWQETIDPTIGFLKRLDSIILKQCKRLKNMPDEMKNLTTLTILHVQQCPMLRDIPQDL